MALSSCLTRIFLASCIGHAVAETSHHKKFDAFVKLDYATYRGSSLPNGISQWLGVRYAAPPTGQLRFEAPQDPIVVNGVQDAIEHGPICLPTPGSETKADKESEDCLFLDVYAPTAAAQSGGRLPVYFFIQGGGFSRNSNSNYNGSGLIAASGNNIVVVNFNYRVGPFGFLASKEIQDHASLNNGLKDQRKALHWVQKYIHLFGGDPGHVTIGGDSAGGQSVNLHVTAYGGRDDRLFHAAAAESQSAPGIRCVEENQYLYDSYVNRTGCYKAHNTLDCLRHLDASTMQRHNIQVPFPGLKHPPLNMYGPTLDYDFIRDHTSAAFAKGAYVKVPAIGGDTTDEGTMFAPADTDTVGKAESFLRDAYPTISDAQLKTWKSFYTPASFPNFATDKAAKASQGKYFQALSTGYGELRYICPGIRYSQYLARDNVPNWNYRWNVQDAALHADGLGVKHTIEINAIWGPGNTGGAPAPASYYPEQSNGDMIPLVQAYWTSFIRNYDPNTHRLPGSPEWLRWTAKKGYRRLMFLTNETSMEDIPQAQRQRCAWADSIAPSLLQ